MKPLIFLRFKKPQNVVLFLKMKISFCPAIFIYLSFCITKNIVYENQVYMSVSQHFGSPLHQEKFPLIFLILTEKKCRAHMWRYVQDFIIKYLKRRMRKQTSHQINQRTYKQIQELMSLVGCNSSYQLSFNPFCDDSFSIEVVADANISSTLFDLPIPQRTSVVETYENNTETQELLLPQEGVSVISPPNKTNQQKNQLANKSKTKIQKTKKIQKSAKTKKVITQMALEQESELYICQEAQMTTAPDDTIRGQNNLKAYQKLLKNYIEQNNYGYLLQEYRKCYGLIYFFQIALLMIKYYINSNFPQQYAQIVEKEVKAQKNKIAKKAIEKGKLKQKIRQMKLLGKDTSDLQFQRDELQSKICHIEVVIYEIREFSMRSCTAFFQGDIEESLKILYTKNRTVMTKGYLFRPALLKLKEIQAQVRKTSSRN